MTKASTPTATIPDSTKNFRLGYAAALWALIFAALHIAWALGWYVGLDHDSARQAFQRRWFLVYDLVAAGLCVVASAVALALAQPRRRRLPYSLVGLLALGATGILALRGAAGVAQVVYLAAVTGNLPDESVLWDVWFCLGALLYGISVWQFRRTPRLPATDSREWT